MGPSSSHHGIDIYISRKNRRGCSLPFAFVRFDSIGGAERAVEKMNDTYLGMTKMAVKIASYKRRHARDVMKHNARPFHAGKEKGGDGKGGKGEELQNSHDNKEEQIRKTVQASADKTQVEILRRSLIAESVNTIRFGWVKEQIAKRWDGPGEVVCRDLGPFKCVLNFESEEARDVALRSEGLKSLLLELRPQWGFTRTISSRVWLEITGVPIHLWSEETFFNIGKLWGKPVMMDELTDYYLSYTFGSILIDSYQWDLIHEWIVLEDGERKFDVYVKEFGREMYCAQAHPGICFEDSICNSGGNDAAVQESSRRSGEDEMVEVESGRRNDEKEVEGRWDPIIDEIIMKRCAERDTA
ncbi:hypothetical protein PIB30_001177 [Stylosanthes scabra]|uniref:RRM domain-containing protein n=1 Tax=Stylosanthes scabra TaxID=79078 RepID=A0ABU6V119_9FABA|nr:hypothetical protein [Stylosanthes scabra]